MRICLYRVADPRWAVIRNRYYIGEPWESTIGIGVVLWRWCLSLVWGKPITPNEWAKRGFTPQGDEQ